MEVNSWHDCPSPITRSVSSLQIWSASFDREDCSGFIPLLSKEELSRAARLKDKALARKQIISRGILRRLLGIYLEINPNALVFKHNQFGKPVLAYPSDSPVGFNLSHSGNQLLIAVGRAGQVGIDVEKIEKTRRISSIAPLVFSAAERNALSRSVSPASDFYSLWTAKEAILKCAGMGFSYPSSRFSVSISEGVQSPANLPDELTGGLACWLSSFTPVFGYAAAVAVLQ